MYIYIYIYIQTPACKIYVSASSWNSIEITLRSINQIKRYPYLFKQTKTKFGILYFKVQTKKAIGREMFTHRGSNLWKEIKPSIKNLGWFSFKTQCKTFIKNYNSS